MADEKDLDKEIESIIGASSQLRKIFEDQMRVQRISNSSEMEVKKASLKMIKDTIAAQTSLKKSAESLHISIEGLKNQFNEGELTAEELSEELGYLRTQVAKTTDADKKAALIKAKSELEEANARAQANKIFKDSMGQVTGVALAGAMNAYTGAAKKALAGGSGLEVAASFMEAGIDTTNKATQAGANALSSFGAATAGAGGKVGAFGIAASVAGAAVGFLSNQMSELAKAGIGFMLSQTTKMIAGFNQLSSSGAIFAGGMKEMISTSQGAGLTLEQFSKAVGENRDKLAAMGLGIGEASKRMAGAMRAGGDEARKQMYALGLSSEEQAGAYATVMQRLAGPTQTLKATNEQVAAATMKYVTDLKTLQSITGEDIKSKQDKIRQENDTLAFQQQLAKMAPEKAAALQAAMDNMTEGQRAALRERMIYGAVISKDLAVAEATNDGIRKNHELTYQAAKDGSLSAEKQRDIQMKTRSDIEKGALANEALARAQSDVAVGASKRNLEEMQYTGKFTEEAKKNAEKNAKEAKGQTGKDSAAGLQEVNQKFALGMQEIAENNLPQFAKALDSTITDIGKAVKELAGASVSGGTSLGAGAANVLGMVEPIVSAALPFIIKSPALAAGGAALAAGTGAGTVAAGAGAAGGIGSKLLGAGKFLGGGLLKGGIGSVLGMGAEYAGDKLKESGHETLGAGASILGKTAKYAAMGSMLGPMGTLAGGALGAGMGLYENWGSLFGKTKTPVTDAKGTLTEKTQEETSSSSTTTSTVAAADPQSVQNAILDKMTELVDQNKKLVVAQNDLHTLMRDSKDIAQKHLRVVS
jgi:hypothetical protein